MKYELSVLATLLAMATARPTAALHRREVPQEHSHDRFLNGTQTSLNLNNPDKIQDTVFGLLGNAAAAEGAGSITNLDCLHQATADQAFTNAKAAGDITGQSDALIYAALERNTGKVGLASVICNETAVNPEIAAISQHQDPASTGAAAINKAIVLELAKQLAAIGANPQDALLSGTFKAGSTSDNTGKGNTCDTVNDPEGGCIFSQNLLVEDATAAEITAAVAGIKVGSGSNSTSNGTAADACPATTAPAASAAPAVADAVASATNVQTFTGTLGGAAPAVESSSGTRPFSVNGNSFVNIGAALQRSCAVQNTVCSNAANSGTLAGTNVGDCNAQEDACNAAASAKVKRAALDFGSCSSPAIEFAVGLDGRKEASFQAVSQDSFNHGSALKIGVISAFVCQRLSDSCKASAAAISACAAGQSASASLTGQASADAFNSALGVSA